MIFLTPRNITIAAVVAMVASAASAQTAGSLRGVVRDREFEVPVPDCTVTIVELAKKVLTDPQGNYIFTDVAAGRYTLVFTKEGYARFVRAEVVVVAGKLSDIDVDIEGAFEDMDEFVVQEIQMGGSEAALLSLRLDSPALLDSIGIDMISRSGASDAAAALLLVPGASVQDGKYAVIRGLPDRYVSAQLDGVRLPTSDGERRAVQLDQFPATVIQSLQVTKTFTPDQQGDASGGAVNVVLRDIPDTDGIQVKSQIGFNSQTRGKGNFLTYQGGGLNTWGSDEGRGVPTDLIGDSWPNAVGTESGDAPIEWKGSVSGGGKYEFDEGVKVGVFVSFFYEQDSTYFDNGIEDSYWVDTPGGPMVPESFQGTPTDGDFKTLLLDVTQGSQSVQWGTLGAIGVETENHKVSAKYLYTRLAVDTATLAVNTRGKDYYFPGYDVSNPSGPGNAPSELMASPWMQLQTLEYTETSTDSVILGGEHKFGFDGLDAGEVPLGEVFGGPTLDWTVSFRGADYNQPNKTQFGAIWLPASTNPGFPPFIPPFDTNPIWLPYKPDANFTLGNAQHIWQDIHEDSNQFQLNFTLPFEQWNGLASYFKAGVFSDAVTRQFNQDTYSNFNDNSSYESGWDEPWSAVFPDQDHPITAGPPYIDVDYTGAQNINAFYSMAEVPLHEEFKLVGGARLESTSLQMTNSPEADAVWFPPGATAPVRLNPGDGDVDFSQTNVLPSLAFSWTPLEPVTVRGSVAQTIARQTFRELSPILQQEYLGGPIFIGNPYLQMSDLNNYDLRIDYVPAPGWFFSSSWFYKDVTNPIEYVQAVAEFTYTTPQNYPSGSINGFEFEGRMDFSTVKEGLRGLSIGANATLMQSSVQLPQSEIDLFSSPSIMAPMSSRAMTGTPTYLYNVNLQYDCEPTGTNFGIFYNIVGDTLESGAAAADGNFVPSIYQTPTASLNVTISQKLFKGVDFFMQAKNLTNPEIQTVYRSDYIAADVLNSSYTAGIDFAFGLKASFEF